MALNARRTGPGLHPQTIPREWVPLPDSWHSAKKAKVWRWRIVNGVIELWREAVGGNYPSQSGGAGKQNNTVDPSRMGVTSGNVKQGGHYDVNGNWTPWQQVQPYDRGLTPAAPHSHPTDQQLVGSLLAISEALAHLISLLEAHLDPQTVQDTALLERLASED